MRPAHARGLVVGLARRPVGRVAGRPGRLEPRRTPPRPLTGRPALVAGVPLLARTRTLVGLVLLPAPGLAEELARPVVPVYIRGAPSMETCLPLVVSRRGPEVATPPPVVGGRTPGPRRPPVGTPLGPTAVPSERRVTLVGVGLVTGAPGVAAPRPVVHAATPLPVVPCAVVALARGGTVGLPDVTSCAVARILVAVPVTPVVTLVAIPPLAFRLMGGVPV